MVRKIIWGVFLLLSFVVTLPLSWWVLSKIDFGYAYFHDHAGIAENIERYAPKNESKKDFEITTKEKRFELFSGIVKSIENQGAGLEALSYLNKQNHTVQLLTQAEITHLKDVSSLLEKAFIAATMLLFLWLFIVVFLRYQKSVLPPAKQVMFSTLIILLIIVGILSLGPEKVFNQLHVWVFPNNHQWFFYYEESLMSTMMKAPDLFAYIAALWFVISAILTIILWKVLHLFLAVK